jgi:hypothetical protein
MTFIRVQAMDLLDQEASEDEGIRKTYAASQKHWDRLPSYEANLELTGKERRYRQLLDQAAESDDRVRDKWNSWEGTIVRLTWDEVSFVMIFHLYGCAAHCASRRSLNDGFQNLQPPTRGAAIPKMRKLKHTRALSAATWRHSKISGEVARRWSNVYRDSSKQMTSDHA